MPTRSHGHDGRHHQDCVACKEAAYGLCITKDGDVTLDDPILERPPPPDAARRAIVPQSGGGGGGIPQSGPFASFAAAAACKERRDAMCSAGGIFSGEDAICGTSWSRKPGAPCACSHSHFRMLGGPSMWMG